MSKSEEDSDSRHLATRLVRLGRDKHLTGQFVNPPVIHASTVLFDNVEDMTHNRQRYTYGRRGTPTLEALETAISVLEGATGTVLCPSGLSAVATALLSALQSGDHLLMADCVYQPTRHFALTVLKRLGIETTFYDPTIGVGIEALFTERTRALYMEVPGSLTFEMTDVPAMVAAAKTRGATTILDNTWATPLFFKPLAAGVDITLLAATKYIGGHSDLMLGTVSASGPAWVKLKQTHGAMGLCAGPDDIYLALRGLRTLAVRLERHWRSALTVASWLKERPEVARVLYPPLEGDPGHAIWQRDMSGGSGLLGFVLRGWSGDDACRFVDGLRLFGIGASWGGFESLAIVSDVKKARSAVPWLAEGPLIRLHIGLEDAGDLIADLGASLAAVAEGH
jgi:cystathionine beta-lyase